MEITKWLEQVWVNNLITLVSIIAAILAWVAKLRWSKEYSDAKNAVIEAKEASISEKGEQVVTKQSQIVFLEQQIEFFKERTPQKIREHYRSVQEQLEEIIGIYEQKMTRAKARLAEQESKLERSGEIQINLAQEIKVGEIRIKQLTRELSISKKLQTNAQRLEDPINTQYNKRVGYRISIENFADQDMIHKEDYYIPYPNEITVDSIVEWYLENYKDPVDGVPWVDGEYFYVYGGPYHSDEELFEHFPEVDENIIIAASEKIDSDGTADWVKHWQY